MQFRTGVKILAVATLAVLLIAPIAKTGGITTSIFAITDDSTKTSVFYMGAGDAPPEHDFDTSVVYDAQYWEDITIGVKSAPVTPGAAALDSGAVTFVLQMSNDKIYWTPIDSIVVVDSLPAFKDLTPQKYGWGRFIVHDGVKTDNLGVKAVGTIRNWGQY